MKERIYSIMKDYSSFIRIAGFSIFTLILFFASSCQVQEKENVVSLTKYVNPYIGSDEHGHVFVGANVPYGFVQLGPTQFSQGWDWCSGYHYSDSTIIGFGHQHLSGTGIGDLGDISLMPVIGDVKTTRGTLPDQDSGIYSYFSRENELVAPGYYSVFLDRFNIGVKLTASNRVGFHNRGKCLAIYMACATRCGRIGRVIWRQGAFHSKVRLSLCS